jgi:hypothetical protein
MGQFPADATQHVIIHLDHAHLARIQACNASSIFHAANRIHQVSQQVVVGEPEVQVQVRIGG